MERFVLALFVLSSMPLDVSANQISDENIKPGTPQAEWDVGSGSDAIRGFATDISYQRGDLVSLKVNTPAAFRVEIYRVGYYGGNGARMVATVNGSASQQPVCITNAELFDCGNWRMNAAWRVPSDAVSGVYIGKLIRDDTGEASHVVFVVRDDASHSDLLVQTSDTTWQAYNEYGGGSLYRGAPTPTGRAVKVSYNRPLVWRNSGSYAGVSNFFNSEYPMVRWLEANGYDVTYTSGVDTDRHGDLLQNHRVFVSSGHDEYWSGQQRVNVEAARDAGVSLAFFSGNEVFWKTRWEDSIAGTRLSHRTLVTYKETFPDSPRDPLDPPTWTGTWRDASVSPPSDGGRPENALTGTLYTVNGISFGNLVVDSRFKGHSFWSNTDVAALPDGASITLGASILGFEWDEDVDNGFRPAGLVRLSETANSVLSRLADAGNTYVPGTSVHSLTLYEHPSGALVFGAGTVQWAWGLDATHDNNAGAPVAAADKNIQQATRNLFSDMEVSPK